MSMRSSLYHCRLLLMFDSKGSFSLDSLESTSSFSSTFWQYIKHSHAFNSKVCCFLFPLDLLLFLKVKEQIFFFLSPLYRMPQM